jgi:hypothetical protein
MRKYVTQHSFHTYMVVAVVVVAVTGSHNAIVLAVKVTAIEVIVVAVVAVLVPAQLCQESFSRALS